MNKKFLKNVALVALAATTVFATSMAYARPHVPGFGPRPIHHGPPPMHHHHHISRGWAIGAGLLGAGILAGSIVDAVAPRTTVVYPATTTYVAPVTTTYVAPAPTVVQHVTTTVVQPAPTTIVQPAPTIIVPAGYQTCPRCGGRGKEEHALGFKMKRCKLCDGKGYLPPPPPPTHHHRHHHSR